MPPKATVKGKNTPARKIKSEDLPNNVPSTVTAPNTEDSTEGSAEIDGNHQIVSDTKSSSSAVCTTNPLYGRADSANVKEEDNSEVQIPKTSTRTRNPPRTPRAPRKKPAVNRFAEVTKLLQTPMEKDDGVVVDCSYMAPDSRAILDESTQTWTHILKLSSPLPFNLMKSTVLPTGPYTNHLALLIRQETPFRFLALPLYIRTKIYALLLTHPEPAIRIVMKGSTRTVWSPTYHSPHKLALLRTSQQVYAEANPMLYTQPFAFSGTQVAGDFLLRISRNRALLRSLRCETYASQSARTMFHLLAEARGLQRLSFAHVSSNETPKKAVGNIWNDAGNWLVGIDRSDPLEGLGVLMFGERAFHIRVKDKKAGGFRVTAWGPAEQLEFLNGLKAKMVVEGKRAKKVD